MRKTRIEMNDMLVSLIRTIVPVVVGSFISWAARHGLDLNQAEITAWLTPTLIVLYYVIVRELEERYPPVGKLLGVANKPEYIDLG